MSKDTTMSTTATERPAMIRHARGKRPHFYDTPGLDEAMAMIMVLANEISVLRDRIDAGERVAKQAGIDLAAGIEAIELDDAALAEREARRQDFLRRLYYLQLKDADEARGKQTAQGYADTIAEIAEI